VSIPAPSNGTRLSRHEEDEEAQAKNGHKRKLDSNSVRRRLSTTVLPAIAQTLPLPRPKALRSTVAATPPYPDTDLPDGVETEVSSNAASNLEASGMQHCVEFASYDDLIPTYPVSDYWHLRALVYVLGLPSPNIASIAQGDQLRDHTALLQGTRVFLLRQALSFSYNSLVAGTLSYYAALLYLPTPAPHLRHLCHL